MASRSPCNRCSGRCCPAARPAPPSCKRRPLRQRALPPHGSLPVPRRGAEGVRSMSISLTLPPPDMHKPSWHWIVDRLLGWVVAIVVLLIVGFAACAWAQPRALPGAAIDPVGPTSSTIVLPPQATEVIEAGPIHLPDLEAVPPSRETLQIKQAGTAEVQQSLARLTQQANAPSREGAQAAWQLGLVHLHGAGVPVDPVQAQSWFERAAQSGAAQAQAGLAWCHLQGCTTPRIQTAPARPSRPCVPCHAAAPTTCNGCWPSNKRLSPSPSPAPPATLPPPRTTACYRLRRAKATRRPASSWASARPRSSAMPTLSAGSAVLRGRAPLTSTCSAWATLCSAKRNSPRPTPRVRRPCSTRRSACIAARADRPTTPKPFACTNKPPNSGMRQPSPCWS
ncbi:hypothetical protein CCO03_09500 [Comamonas serinivorans]|uniref:Sel1 repeat family protein n=1 Tax=Comamonas serinivorans TaxID=1082851 RepID=A0A1Y0EMM4_9BURK|nr:hypothetical protein CCO03_09500 [Comamonas serinivorans]